MAKTGSTEKVVREIRRHTRRRFSAEEKIRIVLEGLRGEEGIAALCRREGLAPAVGLLEVLLPLAAPGPSLEPQARASRVLRAATESAPPDDPAGAQARPASVGGTAGAEPDLGARFHERDALRRPADSAADHAR